MVRGINYHSPSPSSRRMLPSHGDSDEPLPFELTDVDRAVLASTDEAFHLHTWDDLKAIIGITAINNHTNTAIWIDASGPSKK